jgi:hypothetical protein
MKRSPIRRVLSMTHSCRALPCFLRSLRINLRCAMRQVSARCVVVKKAPLSEVSPSCSSSPTLQERLWRPQLRDPSDELVLEAAANGRAEAINRRDFAGAAQRFGIQVPLPGEALMRVAGP